MNHNRILKMAGLVLFMLLLSSMPLLSACAATPTSTPTSTATPTPTATPTTKPTPTVAPTAAPTPTTKPTPTATQAAKTLVLKFAGRNPPTHPLSITMQLVADEVSKRTNGRIKIELYPSNSLVKESDIPDAVKSGLAQLGDIVPAYKAAQLPLFNVAALPFNTSNILVYGLACDDIAKNHPALQAELKSLNLHFLAATPVQEFHLLLTKPIKTLDDLKGWKIRTHGDILPDVVRALGAVPVGMVSTEVYEALQRRTADGMFMYEGAVYDYKWYEIAKYMARVHAGIMGGAFTAMNLDTWNSLSPEDQKLFDEISIKQMDWEINEFNKRFDTMIAEMKAKGFTYIDLPAADVAKLKEIGVSMWNKWAATQDSKGLAGTAVVKAWKDALAKYEKEVGSK